MLKVTVDQSPKKDPPVSYPCLCTGEHTGKIVLFSSSDRGVVIYKGTSFYSVGDSITESNHSGYTLITDPVTLQYQPTKEKS